MPEAAQSTRSHGLSGNALKLIACIAMFLDHTVKALPIQGMLHTICADVIGRIAFPLFTFFLVEGFVHTKNRAAYLLRLALFALLAEIPFDLVIYHRTFFWRHQNTLWTLLLGFLAMLCMEKIEEKKDLHVAAAFLLQVAVAVAFAAAGHYLHVDYHARGVACVAILYMMRHLQPRSVSIFWGSVCLNLNGFQNGGAFLSVIPLTFYNGERGRANLKYAFYVFYPAHLLLLYFLRRHFF